MRTKRIALLLAVVTLLSSFIGILPASAAFSAEEKYDVLCALGFFDSEMVFNGGASVTKAEVITALVNAMPEEKKLTFSGNETGFSDITGEDAFAKIAYNARMMGIMGEQPELNAYESATIEDVSFMLLNLLGYGTAVKENYTSFASGLGLLNGLPSGKGFTMNQLVQMLYNALDTEVLQVEMAGEQISMVQNQKHTYLTDVLDGGKGRGQIVANRFVGISGEEPTYCSDVKIGDAVYLAEKFSVDAYFGQVVDFYYRNNADDEPELVYVKTSRKDGVLSVDAENIESFEDMTYTYLYGETSERTKRASIKKSSDIIYNGKIVSGEFDSYVPQVGNITFIDNDGNNSYEVVIITDYDLVTVSGIDREKGIIKDLYYPERSYEIDLYAEQPCYQVLGPNGEVRKFTDIYKYSTIFIAQSQDKEVTTILVNSEFFRGTVNSISDEKVVIDGTAYEMSEDFLTFNPNVKLRSYGTFYLDPKGRVAAYEMLGDRSIKSGYLLKYFVDDSGMEDNTIGFKLFTEAGEMVTLYSAQKFYYTIGNDENPERVKFDNDPTTLFAELERIADADETFGGGQLILYKQNSEGRITEIETVAQYSDAITMEQFEKREDNGIFRQIAPLQERVTHKTGLFNLNYRIGPNTKVYSIPSDIQNKDKFEVYTGTTNCFQWNQQYTTVAFAKNPNSPYADYVLGFLGGTAGATDENYVFVVESVKSGLNQDDIPIKTIIGYWGNTKKEFLLDEEQSEREINGGDIYQLGFDDDGNVITMVQKFDASRRTLATDGSLTGKFYCYFANAYDMNESTLRVTTLDLDNTRVERLNQTINTFADKMALIYKYDSKRKILESADYSDIVTYKQNPSHYSQIFAWFYYADHKMMIIYDKEA
ncbi:MAG: hypothetical protein E7397_07405 [Ruminococcaceae bacterium]|nr:hypothetical protein [Oscillospiraceae bacterium]